MNEGKYISKLYFYENIIPEVMFLKYFNVTENSKLLYIVTWHTCSLWSYVIL